MATVILSPHLDDAVLSCWHLLSGTDEVRIVNVFAGVPGGAAGWWDRLTGATDARNRMRERRHEDRAALAIVGRDATNLDFMDAQYRSNGDEPSTLEAVLAHVEPHDTVWVPAALRGHRDHALVRDAGLALRDRGHEVAFYADLPQVGLAAPPAPLDLRALRPEPHRLDAGAFERKLMAVGCYATQVAALERMAPLHELRTEVTWTP